MNGTKIFEGDVVSYPSRVDCLMTLQKRSKQTQTIGAMTDIVIPILLKELIDFQKDVKPLKLKGLTSPEAAKNIRLKRNAWSFQKGIV